MPRRLVTVFGGSGFVGRHLVKSLASDGWIVRVAVRDVESATFLKVAGDAGQINPVAANILDPETVAQAVAGATAVVNLVGILYESGKSTFQRIHVDGAKTVASAAKSAGVERLVQMSAIGADPHSEAEYGRTKAAGELAVRAAFPGASIIRPSVVFGPEDDFFNRFARMAQILPVLPVFPTRFQPVYVGDVASAVVRILSEPTTRDQTYELGGPRIITFRDLMEFILRETARRRLLVDLPLFIAEINAWFLEKLPVPPLTRDQVKLLTRENVVSGNTKTLADLGITPTAMEAVVPGYLRQYRKPLRQGRRA